MIESRKLPIKFPFILHWPEWNVPISEMIPDKINGITLRHDMRMTRFSVSPLIQAARRIVVDMKSLDSLRERKTEC